MSLKHAILVLLENEPGSGYDLAQRFKTGIGHFWNAKHQQVYLELKKLHRAKWVGYEVENQVERPDRKIYRITRAGQRALKEWFRKPLKPPQVKDALLVKVFGGHAADAVALIAEIDEHLTFHRRKLEEYRVLEQGYFSQSEAIRERYRLPYLTLRRGIRYAQATIDWLDETREWLAEDGLPRQPVLPSAVKRRR